MLTPPTLGLHNKHEMKDNVGICLSPSVTFNTCQFIGQKENVKKVVKYKTELCRSGKRCNYGPSCLYAHSLEELRRPRVSDLALAGKVNAEMYRNKPCDIFVMTGAW